MPDTVNRNSYTFILKQFLKCKFKRLKPDQSDQWIWLLARAGEIQPKLSSSLLKNTNNRCQLHEWQRNEVVRNKRPPLVSWTAIGTIYTSIFSPQSAAVHWGEQNDNGSSDQSTRTRILCQGIVVCYTEHRKLLYHIQVRLDTFS